MGERRRFDVDIPEGQHLGFSRDTDGAYRAHLFDDETGGLVGHAELHEVVEEAQDSASTPEQPSYSEPIYVREPQDDDEVDVLGALVALGIVVAAARAAPHVAQWWEDTARPGISAVRARAASVLDRLRSRRGASTDVAALDDRSEVESVTAVPTTEIGAPAPTMTAEEATKRRIAAAIASRFVEEQHALLSQARIVDGPDAAALVEAIGAIEPGDIEDVIATLLSSQPGLLEAENVTPELDALLQSPPESLPLRTESPGADED